MGDTISGSVYFSGIGNGTDFSSIIEQLQKIEEIPKQRLELWRADWQLRYDAFDEVCKAMTSARSTLANINTTSKFVTKIATSSEATRMSATANAEATDSTHTIDVEQLASNAIWAFNGQFDSKTSSVNNTGQSQLFSYTYKGKTREIKIANGTTLESMMNIVNNDSQNLGVRMSLIQSEGKYSFQVQGKDSGEAATLKINPSGLTSGSNGNIGGGNSWSSTSSITDLDTALKSSSEKIYFSYTASGTAKTIELAGDSTWNQIASAINAAEGSGTATFTGAAGAHKLVLDGNISAASMTGGKPSADLGFTGSSTKVADVTTWDIDPGITDPTAALNFSKNLYFEVSIGGSYNFDIDPSWSLNRIVSEINSVTGGNATAALTGTPGNYSLSITDATKISIDDATGLFSGNPSTTIGDTTWTSDNPLTMPLSAGDTARLSFNITGSNGRPTAINVNFDGDSTDSAAFLQAINDAVGYNVASLDGSNKLVLNGIGISNVSMSTVSTVADMGLTGTTSNSGWTTQEAQDARFWVDNWPKVMTSSSNAVSEAIPGMTINLYDTGKAQISVTTDKTSVQESIQTFLDAINSVLTKINDLSKVDENKSTYSSSSQFTSEKGSVLTGNYGVQLLKSRLQTMVTSTPPGFNKIQGSDLLSGDMVASLAEMGIKLCTEEGNPSYGLFMIAPPSNNADLQLKDQERFDNALEKSLDAVIELFSCDSKGSSNSADFRYASHIKGTTMGGSYDVTYDVDDSGNIGKVYINGKEAHLDASMGPTWYTAGTDAGNAAGMAIVIDDLTPGNHSGKISIKQGLTGQLEDFLKGELKEDKFGHNSGAMVILKDNYKAIMDNIDKKIEKEETRVLKWVQTQRLAFSRLETLLGQYELKQKQVTSQLSQLASDS